jgi:hypothetical protein
MSDVALAQILLRPQKIELVEEGLPISQRLTPIITRWGGIEMRKGHVAAA